MNVLVVIAPASSWGANRGFRHAVEPGKSRSLCGKNVENWQVDGATIDTVPFAEARVGCRVCIRAHDTRVAWAAKCALYSLIALTIPLYACGGAFAEVTESPDADFTQDAAPDAAPDQHVELHPDAGLGDVTDADASSDVDASSPDVGPDVPSPPPDAPPPPDSQPDDSGTYTHSNGIGGSWTDNVQLGTYDKVQALHACAVLTSDINVCYNFFLADGGGIKDTYGQSGWSNGTCYVWQWFGPYTGYVSATAGQCTVGTTYQWN